MVQSAARGPETTHGLPVGRVGIEAQIETAQGLANLDAIAGGPRVQALILGPADLIASLNMRTLEVELILEAYEWHTSSAGGARGAVMLGDEMLDEASRKMALVIAAKGRAAGMTRHGERFQSPD